MENLNLKSDKELLDKYNELLTSLRHCYTTEANLAIWNLIPELRRRNIQYLEN